ncbi:uncharacterized protein VTP21DRAFT_4560 [Calcarisporiella thermophila]|uniref:uncharacterized protein n=1 Tax=Calcarisporiella thermophila TaxID=911321 RepID=UPI003743E44E
MALQKHFDINAIIEKSLCNIKTREHPELTSLAYASRYEVEEIPKFSLPEKPVDPRVAYQMITDEMEVDGRPQLNCASFLTTWMEPEAEKLIVENLYKNYADQDEYPMVQEISKRCVSMLSRLWGAEKGGEAIGTPTVGSSEGVFLGVLAMKRRWKNLRRSQGKDFSKPNLIYGHEVQVAIEKAANYLDIEARIVDVSAESNYVMDPKAIAEKVDENTIGVVCVLGSTYTGHLEDVEGISKVLDKINAERGLDVPIHVDAASGGFIVPFAFENVKWDFRVKRVVSINASGHKYGLVYPGCGWVIWKNSKMLSEDLIYELHYLGGTEKTYTINFSRPACFIVAQYYMFIRLGFEGYCKVISGCLDNARLLSRFLEKSTYYEVLSDVHRNEGGSKEDPCQASSVDAFTPALPVVAFRFSKTVRENYPNKSQFAISSLLRTRGWIVPNYSLPPKEDQIQILRVVVRESMPEDAVDRFLRDLMWCTELLLENGSGDQKFWNKVAGGMPETEYTIDIEPRKSKTYSRAC